MSGSTATITFKLDGDVKTFQILAKDAENLKKVLGNTISEAQELNDKLLSLNQAAEAFRGMETLIRGIESAFGSLSAEYNEASANETRLAQSMKTAMGATQEQVDAIIALTDAQEELGVVDGQFQISAAQQLAKFLQTTESLQTLIPLMNDMAAQQYGVAASEQNLMSITTEGGGLESESHPLFHCISVRSTSALLLNIQFSKRYKTFWVTLNCKSTATRSGRRYEAGINAAGNFAPASTAAP